MLNVFFRYHNILVLCIDTVLFFYYFIHDIGINIHMILYNYDTNQSEIITMSE